MEITQVYFLLALFAARSTVHGEYLTLEACNEAIVEKYNSSTTINRWACVPGHSRTVPVLAKPVPEQQLPWRWSTAKGSSCYGSDTFCGRK